MTRNGSYEDLLRFNEATGYYTWPKYSDVKFNEYFSTFEFRCRCINTECNEQRIHKDIIDKLTYVRQELGAPIIVTSAYRCPLHQEALRKQGLETAKGISTHELGNAADIQTKEMSRLARIAEPYFMAMGVARSFIHVDLRDDRLRRWGYK